jgi:magnesium chelatase family protein
MNPCPCGFAGDPVHDCRCTPQEITRYRSRISGPLLDRLDLTVEVPAVPPEILGDNACGEASAAVRARVVEARMRQVDRTGRDGIRTNAALTAQLMAKHCRLDSSGLRILGTAVRRLGLTARGYDRTRKIARTVADLDGETDIRADHIAEALQFRMTV